MKLNSITAGKLLLACLSLLLIASCQENEDPEMNEVGEMIVKFDNQVGNLPMQLQAEGSDTYPYTNANGQPFNITRFGYYISHVRLEGPNGELFIDEMNASADANEVKGYYQVVQGDPDSYAVHLHSIPAGQYDRIHFTLGIKEDGIQEGAVGGLLDRAAGAWFWNWNSGYINLLFEGHSPVSPQEQNALRIHLGGWKNIPAEGEQPQRFFDNNVQISLPFDAAVTVSESLRPSPHIHMDVLKWLESVNFESVNNVHSPAAGQALTPTLAAAFYVDHTHQ
ncbi:MbnP family protein [Cyclobacterium xiamenense]|uniref:MbnP family protein n=1 Tax=Cyclobacterium xiamenense TaxID=1297121 RepID=UPI0035CEBF45